MNNYQPPYEVSTNLACAYGNERNNELNLVTNLKTLKAYFVVKSNNGAGILYSLEKAIKAYNELP
jgi:hypothetical protein